MRTGNGVVDKSTSTLLEAEVFWDEVYPKPSIFRRGIHFKVLDENVRVRRERDLLGPLFGIVGVFEGEKLDAGTLALRRQKFGGLRLKIFGLKIPVPWIFRKKIAMNISFLYVDSDLVILNSDRIIVLAPSLERSLFTALLYVARRYQAQRQRKQQLPSSEDSSKTVESPPIGDLVWHADTSMDVDDVLMQSFLDEPTLQSNFSVQDMLDRNFDESHVLPSSTKKKQKPPTTTTTTTNNPSAEPPKPPYSLQKKPSSSAAAQKKKKKIKKLL